MKADTRKSRSEQIAVLQAPQNRAWQARKSSSSEQRGVARVTSARSALVHFMDRATRKPAARKQGIEHIRLPNLQTSRMP